MGQRRLRATSLGCIADRFHAGSHLYSGFELLWGLLLLSYLGVSRGSVVRTTWSIWLVVLSWLFAPFWFNPLAFDRAKLKNDLSHVMHAVR